MHASHTHTHTQSFVTNMYCWVLMKYWLQGYLQFLPIYFGEKNSDSSMMIAIRKAERSQNQSFEREMVKRSSWLWREGCGDPIPIVGSAWKRKSKKTRCFHYGGIIVYVSWVCQPLAPQEAWAVEIAIHSEMHMKSMEN